MTLFTAFRIAWEINPSNPSPSIITKIPATMIMMPAYSTNPAPASRPFPRMRETTVVLQDSKRCFTFMAVAFPRDADTNRITVRETPCTGSGSGGPTLAGGWGHRGHPPGVVPSQWAIASLRVALCSFAKMRLMWFLTVFSLMKQAAAI